MQGSTGQGNQNGQQKQGGLSWSQPPSSSGGAKPISQVSSSPLMPKSTPTPAAAKTNSNSAMNNTKKADTNHQGNGRTFAIFIAGVVAGLILGWIWNSISNSKTPVADDMTKDETSLASGTNSTPSSVTPGASTGSTGGVSTGNSTSLSVAPMQAAGLSVAVSAVSVSVPTWVVILDNVNGKPGNALGAQMFFAGEKSGTIELLRATTAGKTYFAAEYIDNGDHKFSKQTDTQVNTITGAQMLVEFSVR